jgi:hypothetical protein
LAVSFGFATPPDGEAIAGVVPVVTCHAEERYRARLLVMREVREVQVSRHITFALAAKGTVGPDQRGAIFAPGTTVIGMEFLRDRHSGGFNQRSSAFVGAGPSIPHAASQSTFSTVPGDLVNLHGRDNFEHGVARQYRNAAGGQEPDMGPKRCAAS